MIDKNQMMRYFDYLDSLRASGAVNMFGAYPYLAVEFSLSDNEAKEIWKKWQDTFTNEPPNVRAARAVGEI